MSDQNGYGGFSAPGPQDPYGGQNAYGSADPYAAGDPYPGQGSADPFGLADGTDPYASEQIVDPYVDGQDPYTAGGYGPGPTAQPGTYPPDGTYPAGGPYQQAGPYYAVLAPTSGAAVASLVLGILGAAGCCVVLGPIGIGFAVSGMKATATPAYRGHGLAVAGLITSIVGSLWTLLFLAYVVFIVVIPIIGYAVDPTGY
jgi:hypothetical protein